MRVSLLLALVALLPTVALAASWTNSGFSQSVIIGISAADDNTVFIAGGDNGVGANVLKSTDAGQTWTSVPIEPTMMLLAIKADSDSQAVVSGLGLLQGGNQYLTHGRFKNSSMPGVSMQEAQDVDTICNQNGDWSVGVVGQWNFYDGSAVNGVAISEDGGQTFTFSNTTLDPNANPTRYGAFPGCATGFLSAGSWPPNSFTGKKGVKELSRNIHLHFHEESGVQSMHFTELDRAYTESSGWSAAIVYSGNNDESWHEVFNASGFYFNEISCPSESVCYAAAENDDNGYIYGTKNAGKTWERLYTAAGTSLMAAQAISENEVFIAGGVLSSLGINGTVFHSTDGGKNFELTSVPGYYFMSLSMLSADKGFAAVMDDMSQSDVLIYA